MRVKEISYGLFEKIYEGFRIMGAKYETKLISKKIESFCLPSIIFSKNFLSNFPS